MLISESCKITHPKVIHTTLYTQYLFFLCIFRVVNLYACLKYCGMLSVHICIWFSMLFTCAFKF